MCSQSNARQRMSEKKQHVLTALKESRGRAATSHFAPFPNDAIQSLHDTLEDILRNTPLRLQEQHDLFLIHQEAYHELLRAWEGIQTAETVSSSSFQMIQAFAQSLPQISSGPPHVNSYLGPLDGVEDLERKARSFLMGSSHLEQFLSEKIVKVDKAPVGPFSNQNFVSIYTINDRLNVIVKQHPLNTDKLNIEKETYRVLTDNQFSALPRLIDSGEGILVLEFLRNASPLHAEHFEAYEVEQLFSLLAQVWSCGVEHTIRSSATSVSEILRWTALEYHSPWWLERYFESFPVFLDAFSKLARQASASSFVLSRLHGDLSFQNILQHKHSSRMYLIDFEMSIMGDPAYDLARFFRDTFSGLLGADRQVDELTEILYLEQLNEDILCAYNKRFPNDPDINIRMPFYTACRFLNGGAFFETARQRFLQLEQEAEALLKFPTHVISTYFASQISRIRTTAKFVHALSPSSDMEGIVQRICREPQDEVLQKELLRQYMGFIQLFTRTAEFHARKGALVAEAICKNQSVGKGALAKVEQSLLWH